MNELNEIKNTKEEVVASNTQPQNKLNEKQKKVVDFLVEKEGYERSDTPNMVRKYGLDNVELVFEAPREGKLDFELSVDESGLITFYIRVDKFIEREFKKFYQNANEVKKVLEERKEVYLQELSELGFKEYFKQEAERLFVDDEQMKNIALWMAEGQIDISDYSEGQTRQIEGALISGMNGARISKKRFDDIKQDDFANFQEYSNHLKDLKSKKERLVGLQRAVERDWQELKDRQWQGMYDWLRTEEQEKRVKQLLRDGKNKEELSKTLAQEYFNTLPKNTQIKLEDVEKRVGGDIHDWEIELLADDMKTWTDEQWKQYLPKEKYVPRGDYKNEPYNIGSSRYLQLKKIDKKDKDNYRKYENDFYQQVVEQQKETFNPEKAYDYCYHCVEGRGIAPFKLIFKTKLRLIYTCSRCENTEIFFDILEWKNEK